jgi:hypothetical protein
MKRVWRQVEGYKTCLPIRLGPLQAIPARYAPAGFPGRDIERSLD